MKLNLDARNPGEFFAGVGLMHVLDAAGCWSEDCATLDLPDVAQAEVVKPELLDVDQFDTTWPSRSSRPVHVRWGQVECTLMWWAEIASRKIGKSKLKTYAGNKSAESLLNSLIYLLPDARTWPEALVASAWTSSSPFKTDTRVIAATSTALGFSPNRLREEERGIKVKIEIYPWVDLLANVGLHMTAVTEPVYRAWHHLVPARCTAAAVMWKEEATEVSFRVIPTSHNAGRGPVYKRFAI